ncbi:MAG: AIPR family protein [Acidobacteriaceae bacterium]
MDDKGIDGIFVNEQLAQIDVFQSRMVTKKTVLGDTGLREFYGALNQMRTQESVALIASTTKNAELSRLIREKEIGKKVAEGYKIQGVFLTNATRNGDAIGYLKTALDLILWDGPELQAGYIVIDKTGPIATPITFKLSKPYIEYAIEPGLEILIVPLPASDLVKMEGIANGELFSWNVRQYLTKKTKVNRDIEKSIQATAEHKYFPAFHNGLTVLCNKLSRANKDLTVSGYAVVNGCQSLTGLYENRRVLTPALCILTKFIHIQPDSTLARKITDHTNNQNGTTYRDLQSNNPIQTRLQSEIHKHYPTDFCYRIKRGEHPEWEQQNKIIIENELAARILLAFDIREPWSCHQTYRLFDDLHAKIFGRPEVSGDRIVSVYEIYESSRAKLNAMKNDLFAHYGLTKFLLVYLVRLALETDDIGNELIQRPSDFLSQPKGRTRIRYCIEKTSQMLVRLLDAEVTRKAVMDPDSRISVPFDFKSNLKSQRAVVDLGSAIIAQYGIAIDSGLAPTFSALWKQSAGGRKKGK